MNLKKMIILVILFVLISVISLIGLSNLFMIEIDHVSSVNHIQDGDTFSLESGYWVRLADIDTPERGENGYTEAGAFLSDLIYQKTVYLDIDDVYTYDYNGEGDRLVCLVFLEVNDTHFLNVNKALLEARHATIYEFYNEFTPSDWQLYTPNLKFVTIDKIVVGSVIFSLIVTYIFYIMYRKIHRFTINSIDRIKRAPICALGCAIQNIVLVCT